MNLTVSLNTRYEGFYKKWSVNWNQELNKFKIYPKSIHCPSHKYKGKPSPDLINACVKKNNFQKKYCFYIGDTNHDYEAAKNAKINFIFANYGYGKKIKRYKNIINKPGDLFKFV